MLKRLFARAERAPRAHAVPEGRRVYAIGDIHGRLDLFDELLARIDADDCVREPAQTTIVLLGDLIDRGPASRGVVERAMRLAKERESIFLKGNHEELLLRTVAGDRRSAGVFARVGGRETMLSYGVAPELYDACDLGELTELARRVVPTEHLTFLDAFEDQYRVGDVCFVHAGVRPGVALADQRSSDLRWIRGEFLEYEDEHEALIVHGHTISEAVEERANRVGIDTGAFRSGVLTAVAFEDTQRWYLST